MASRYSRRLHIQPVRKIPQAITDIPHIFKEYENIDQLAFKYYGDATLGWVIMAGNPEYFMEFLVPIGARLRIPYPLTRVWSALGVAGEL